MRKDKKPNYRHTSWQPLEPLESRVLMSASLGSIGSSLQNSHKAAIRARMLSAVERTSGVPCSGEVGKASNSILLGTFHSTAALSKMSVIIDWGDGQTTVGTINMLAGRSGGSRQFAIHGRHVYAAAGQFQVHLHLAVRVAGGILSRDIQTTAMISASTVIGNPHFPYPITPLAPYFNGGSFTQIVGIASDPTKPFLFRAVASSNFGPQNITIDWGDGSVPTSGVLLPTATPAIMIDGMPVPPTFAIGGNHAYAMIGTYDVTITAYDSDGTQYVADSTATVTQNSPSGKMYSGTPAGPIYYDGSIELAWGLSPFSATIDWGDGTQSPATIADNGRTDGQVTFAVTGSHSYSQPGTYRITQTVYFSADDPLGRISYSTALITDSTALGFNLQIKGETFDKIVGVAGIPDSPYESSTIGGSGFPPRNVIIDWGDGSPQTPGQVSPDVQNASFVVGGPQLIQGGYSIAGNHVYTRAGTYDVTIFADDASGPKYVAHATAQVAQNSDNGQTYASEPNVPISYTGSYLTTGNVLGDKLTSTIDWGDGTTSDATITNSGSSADETDYIVSGGHTYQLPGIYRITQMVYFDSQPTGHILYSTAQITDPAIIN